MKRLILLIACILFCAPPAIAKPFINRERITVDHGYILSPYLSQKVAKRIAREAVATLRRYRIRVVVGKQFNYDDPYETFSSSRLYGEQYGNPFYTEFRYWEKELSKNIPDNTVHYQMAPPWSLGGVGEWRDGAVPYLGGYAQVGLVRKGCLAYGNAAQFGQGGVPKFRQSKLIMEHEVLHCLGALHLNDSANVMHADAQRYYKELGVELPIDPRTIEQIKLVLR